MNEPSLLNFRNCLRDIRAGRHTEKWEFVRVGEHYSKVTNDHRSNWWMRRPL